jgi:hypothetical protein
MMLNKTGSLKNEKNQQDACPKKISMVGALKGTAKAVQHTKSVIGIDDRQETIRKNRDNSGLLRKANPLQRD